MKILFSGILDFEQRAEGVEWKRGRETERKRERGGGGEGETKGGERILGNKRESF